MVADRASLLTRAASHRQKQRARFAVPEATYVVAGSWCYVAARGSMRCRALRSYSGGAETAGVGGHGMLSGRDGGNGLIAAAARARNILRGCPVCAT
jgi:hypothetical protein